MGIFKQHPGLFVGLAITLVFLVFSLVRPTPLDVLNLKLYDLMMGLRAGTGGPAEIVMVEIDADSIEKFGPWPWPRSLIADGILKIHQGRPGAIGIQFILSEAEKNNGLAELDRLQQMFDTTLQARAGEAGEAFAKAIRQARKRLDGDQKLAAAIAGASNVVLPVYFNQAPAVVETGADLRATLRRHALRGLNNPAGLALPRANDIVAPTRALLVAARGIGHVNLDDDADGTVRRERLVYDFQGLYLPSHTLRLAALYRNVPTEMIRNGFGATIRLGSLEIPATEHGELLIDFKGLRGSFERHSFADVINEKLPPTIFTDKLVLVGIAAAGSISTPTDAIMSPGEFSAHVLRSILTERFIRQPLRSDIVEFTLIMVVGLALSLVLPRLGTLSAGITFAFLLTLILGVTVYSFVSRGLWLPTVYPLLHLGSGYIGIMGVKHLVAERRKHESEGQPAETSIFGKSRLQTEAGQPGAPGFSGGEPHPTLGRYEVLRQLGQGAMGIVYLGQDPRINRTVAIKTIGFTEELEPEQAEALKQKFFREAESAGTLSHPNIVTIYDAGEERELGYIAMEFLEGETLEKYTRKENLLSMRQVIGMVADLAEALDYAHQKGIVHRDIKPANIMLLKNGVVKITDFGIARIVATSQTQTGVVKGTPYYMSPEQFSGERVDGRSDIFSLGAMLFQLLTARLPFYGDTPPALMHCIMNVPHPDPRKYNSYIVTPLVRIIDKALEKDKSKRYQRAGQMAGHLRELGRRIDAAIIAKKHSATSQG